MNEQEALLAVRIARNAIESELIRVPPVVISQLPENFSQNGAVFVTIRSKEDGALRGCIGSLIAYRPLFEDIVNNAKSSAFNDPRFPPMIKEELPFVKFELSLLSQPVQMIYSSIDEILQKLRAGIDGVIIKYKTAQATFLPSVWDEINTKEEFLSRLCEKARLPQNFWQTGELEIYLYQAQKIIEP